MSKHLRIKLSTFLVMLAFSILVSPSALGQANIVILNDTDAPGTGFNDTTPVAPVGGNSGTTLGQQRLNAFTFAASIWGATLNSSLTITIRARWDDQMPCSASSGTLGSAGTTTLRQGFPNAPFSGTWYPAALGNALSGTDSQPANPEINATFNPDLGTSGCLQNRPWYYGLDGNHGSGIDFVAVVLHELGHGLGFQSFTSSATGEFVSGVPSVWDRFLLDNTTGKLWVNMTDAERVASAINTGNLVWSGPNVTAGVPGLLSAGADSSNRVLMYAPNPREGGSSVSHFDKSATPNLLMEPNNTAGQPHSVTPPLDLTFSLLRDIGWNSASPPPPSPTPTPSPPANNNFVNALAIGGCSGTVSGTNVGATKESGEPDHASNGGTRSVWYLWQAPNTGSVAFNTSGSGFDTVLGVYTGSAVNSLSLIQDNDDVTSGNTSSRVQFNATAGVVYRIAVGGFNNGGSGGDSGPFVLNWSQDTCSNTWFPIVLNPNQVELKTWKNEGRTFIYAKLTFPDAGFRVANWGVPSRAGNAFTANATIERFNGVSAQAISNTAQIWDLGVLNPGDYTFTFRNSGTPVETLNFTVSSTAPPPNPIDNAREFVRWQYKDFLRREPDGPGWDHWTNEITMCTNPANRRPGESEAACVERKRENTSAAFFVSPEFSSTGYFVLRVYRGSLGRMPHFGGSATLLDEFTRDAVTVGQGIVVNDALAPDVMNANKQAFANEFVKRLEFRMIYDVLNNTQYVDKLFQTTAITPTVGERQALIDGLNGGSETRGSVLFKVVDGTTTIAGGHLVFNTNYGKAFYDQQFNAAFVQMEYFGYLLRDPDPDGYAFWLGKLNFFGDWVNAEMVKSFIKSPEYRARFGAP